ncbi:MAG: flagellar M-ring protein FliF C-terminal domain-containing protein [Kofleriaceae bacterium]
MARPGAVDTRAELERSLTARVRTMLERVVGAGKVSVVTTAVVDDRAMTETQELYDQTNPVLRSESRTVEGDPASVGVGGIAGTRGNLPGAPAAGPTPGGGSSARLQETKNYEVNRTVRQTTKPEMVLQRLHLAIVVDQKVGSDGKPVARTPAEMAELTALARQAAGIDDARGDKIEMRSIAFAPDIELAISAAPVAKGLPIIPLAIGGGALLLVVIALVALKVRKRARHASRPISLALPVPIADFERALDARGTDGEATPLAAGTEPRGLPAGRGVRDRVLDSVRADAERAAEVLTAWLSETPPRGAKP